MRDVEYWQNVGEYWSREQPDRLWRSHSDAVNWRWLTANLQAGDDGPLLKTDLFDEATGEGLLSRLGRPSELRIGIDLSDSIVRGVRTHHPGICSLRADVRHLPFADDSLGVVISNSTLDHFHCFDDLRLSLRELHRVLAPGGKLLLTLDNPANPLIGLRNALPFSWFHRAGIVPYFVGATAGPWRLRALLEEVGFAVEKSEAILHCVRVLAVPLSRMVARLANRKLEEGWLRLLMRIEVLERWPLRYFSGNFVAMVARKRR